MPESRRWERPEYLLDMVITSGFLWKRSDGSGRKIDTTDRARRCRGRGKTSGGNGQRSFPEATKPLKRMSPSEARGKSHAGNGPFQKRADARIGNATGERRASGRVADTHRKSHAVASKTRHGMASCGKRSDGGNELEPSTEQYGHGTPLVRCRQEIFRRESCQPPASGEPPGTRERSSAVLPGLSQRGVCPVWVGGV